MKTEERSSSFIMSQKCFPRSEFSSLRSAKYTITNRKHTANGKATKRNTSRHTLQTTTMMFCVSFDWLSSDRAASPEIPDGASDGRTTMSQTGGLWLVTLLVLLPSAPAYDNIDRLVDQFLALNPGRHQHQAASTLAGQRPGQSSHEPPCFKCICLKAHCSDANQCRS